MRRLLVERRHRAGLTQKQVADRVGRPQRFISRVERGLHRVTVVELIELGKALEFDPAAAVRRVGKS
jgi:transcriptional regulator with XRE-family HTH domain